MPGEGQALSLRRIIAVLGAALAVMLGVIRLRAEATRLNYELSEQERRAAVLLDELREQGLELARLRNPAMIRARLVELRLGPQPEAPPTGRQPAAPSRSRSTRGARAR